MDKLPTNPSESVKKLNPHLFSGSPVRAMETGQCERSQVRPLVNRVQKRQKGKGSVEIVVGLITARRRELDDDGNVAALKPLRDAIAETLGLDDADSRIRFEYGQIESRAKQGVIVKIEML